MYNYYRNKLSYDEPNGYTLDTDAMYFQYNGLDSRYFGVWCENVDFYERKIGSEKRMFTDQASHLNYNLVYGGVYEPCEITLSCFADFSVNDSMLRRLRAWFSPLQPKELVISSEIYQFRMAVVTNVSTLQQIHTNGRFDVTFTCYDPRAFSRFLSTDAITYDNGLFYDSGAIGAVEYQVMCPTQDVNNPCKWNATTAPANAANKIAFPIVGDVTQDISVYHGGNIHGSDALISIVGTFDTIAVENMSSGDKFTYGAQNGAQVSFDGHRKNVYIDGVMTNTTFSGDFISLRALHEMFMLDDNGQVGNNLIEGLNNLRFTFTNANVSEIEVLYRYMYI